MAKQTSQAAEDINFLTILKGILFSYILTIPLFIILAFILTYTSFPESLLTPAVVLATVISVVAAASIVTKNARSRGWLNGGMVGLIYMVVLYLVSSIVCGSFSINRYVLTMAVIGILAGSVGGITGINFSKAAKFKGRKMH